LRNYAYYVNKNLTPVLLGQEAESFGNVDRIEMDWIYLAQDRDQWKVLVNMIMNLRVPENVRKFLSNCTTGGFSRRAHLYG
jgi:hypothetical protein